MQILSPLSPAILGQALKTFGPFNAFQVQDNGDVEVFNLESCDLCGCDCKGANSVTFPKVPEKKLGLFVLAKLEPSDVYGELGANDDGDAVCPSCYIGEESTGNQIDAFSGIR